VVTQPDGDILAITRWKLSKDDIEDINNGCCIYVVVFGQMQDMRLLTTHPMNLGEND
jgi:hypothetical protein